MRFHQSESAFFVFIAVILAALSLWYAEWTSITSRHVTARTASQKALEYVHSGIATAAQALLGAKFRVTQQRGEFVESSLAPFLAATVHPSSILRAPDEAARRAERERFVQDLKKISKAI